MSTAATPEIEYAYERKFQLPAVPFFAVGGAILSILSLLFMTVMSTIMLVQLLHPSEPIVSWSWLPPPAAEGALASWVWLPFAFTIFGAGLGFVFELWLLLAGTAFQQTRTRLTTFVRNVRLLNLAPVTVTVLFFVCCMTMENEALRTAALYVAGGAGFALAFGLFFGGAPALPAILLGIQLVQVLLVLTLGVVAGGSMAAEFLVAQGLLQLTALLIGTATPARSTGFHVISTISGIMLYHAIVGATNSDPAFSHQAAIALPPGSLLRWGFVAVCVAGLLAATRAFPAAFNTFRASASNALWSPVYFLLVSQARFPKPYNLSEIYNRLGTPEPTRLQPYFMQHPDYLPEPLSIPAAEKLEANVSAFSQQLGLAEKVFALIARLDHGFPQANVAVALADKPRLAIWSDGTEYWPWLFTKKIFGRTVPGRTLEKTPEPGVQAYKDGQLLAYLTLAGVAAPFAKPAEGRGVGALVSDFRFLEVYQTKPEYQPYGGMAYFRVNSERRKLELVSVVAPGSSQEIAADPNDPTFRFAESLVLASMYYQVISGKHLAEIHMTYNLVEVALHNAFDAQGRWNHPFRTFMYLHLFSHELAEELTTEHLVQEGAVFSQIFATTHDSLIDHLNDTYRAFEYGEDEDFEARAAAMTMRSQDGRNAGLLPDACIAWELEYAKIWQRYTDHLVDAIYADDAAVQADPCLQAFHRELLALIPRGLPERYAGFRTKPGVSRFASDTIHHLVVRHQVYGTTGVRAAMDPRISTPQVPRDGGTPGVDDWRSLASVALATARARFTLLLGDFEYLLDGVDPHYVAPMHAAFQQLQEDLRVLERDWTATRESRQFNYDFFRPLPSELHTGPGY